MPTLALTLRSLLIPALACLALTPGCDLGDKPIGALDGGDDTGDMLENPSGDCVASDDGTRPCYDGHDGSLTYMPLCDNPRERELWRIFSEPDGTSYMLPRPDATGLDFGICDGDDAELAALFESKALCKATLSSADIELVNSLTLDEAMEISRALHKRLTFTADHPEWSLFPWTPEIDIADACDLYPDAFEGFESECNTIRDQFVNNSDCALVSIEYSDEAYAAFAVGLNLLYDVE